MDGGNNTAFSTPVSLQHSLPFALNLHIMQALIMALKDTLFQGVERLHSTSLPLLLPPFVRILVDRQCKKAQARLRSWWRLGDME